MKPDSPHFPCSLALYGRLEGVDNEEAIRQQALIIFSPRAFSGSFPSLSLFPVLSSLNQTEKFHAGMV